MKTTPFRLLSLALLSASLAVGAIAAPASRPKKGGTPPTPPPEPPAPEVLAADLIAEFDVSLDGNLDSLELIAAFEALKARHEAAEAAAGSGSTSTTKPKKGPRPPKGGTGTPPTPPTPTEIATKLLTDFDVDLNGSLSLAELTEALASLPPPRHGPPPASGS